MRWFIPFLLLLVGCAKPTVSITATGDLSEPDGRATVVVSRSDSASEVVTVRLSYTGMVDDDYTGAQQSVSVPSAGSVTIDLVAVDNTLHEPTESLIVEIVADESYAIDVGKVTLVSEDDDPWVPPKPGDAPWPSPGLSVLILRESQPSKPLPPTQQAIFTSTAVHNWLTRNTVKLSDNQPGYRIWDDDQEPTNAPVLMQEAFKVVKAKMIGDVPMLGVSNGTTGYVGPLPGTIEELLALLEKYGDA